MQEETDKVIVKKEKEWIQINLDYGIGDQVLDANIKVEEQAKLKESKEKEKQELEVQDVEQAPAQPAAQEEAPKEPEVSQVVEEPEVQEVQQEKEYLHIDQKMANQSSSLEQIKLTDDNVSQQKVAKYPTTVELDGKS